MSTTLTDRQAPDSGSAKPPSKRRFTMEIYKKGQGYWTRVMSAVGLGMMVLMGAVWLSGLVKGAKVGTIQPMYLQLGVGLLVFLIFGSFGYYFIGVNTSTVDFLVATEGEMKKVNWSTRRELIGSTWVVIALTILLGLICWLSDSGFVLLFRWMNVLEAGGG